MRRKTRRRNFHGASFARFVVCDDLRVRSYLHSAPAAAHGAGQHVDRKTSCADEVWCFERGFKTRPSLCRIVI